MDTAPQPTDDDALNALIERARQFILGLILYIDGITARLGDAAMSPALARALTRRAILPAEAALRRVIILLAADLPPITPNPRAIPDGAKQRSGTIPAMNTQPKTARPPLFRMSEPQPRPKTNPKADDLPEHLRPRITALTDAVLYAPPSALKIAAPPRDPHAIFCRRLLALHGAFGDPHREARRWLRRRAASSAPARSPLAPNKIPGTRKSLGEHTLSLLRELTKLALQTPALNTS